MKGRRHGRQLSVNTGPWAGGAGSPGKLLWKEREVQAELERPGMGRGQGVTAEEQEREHNVAVTHLQRSKRGRRAWRSQNGRGGKHQAAEVKSKWASS